MLLRPHQVLGFGILKYILQYLSRSSCYIFILFLDQCRSDVEHMCMFLEDYVHTLRSRSKMCILRVVRIPQVGLILIWKVLVQLMRGVLALHYYSCDQQVFQLPSVTFYDLGADYNLN